MGPALFWMHYCIRRNIYYVLKNAVCHGYSQFQMDSPKTIADLHLKYVVNNDVN